MQASMTQPAKPKRKKDYHRAPQINLRLAPDMLRELVAFAGKHRRDRQVVIRDAVRFYLDHNKHKPSLEELD